VREATFTKEPSASIQSVTVDPAADVEETNSNLRERDAEERTSVSLEESTRSVQVQSSTFPLHSSTAPDTAVEQTGSSQAGSPQSSNFADVADEKSTLSADVNISPDYIASLLLGAKPGLKASTATSRSVGNLMSVTATPGPAAGGPPTSPRSGPATPTVARKSIDSQLAEMKKPKNRNKIASLWHRDKPSKSAEPLVKNMSTSAADSSSAVSDVKDKCCRDGLGKSPRVFRKSFPLRKSKKSTAEKTSPEPSQQQVVVIILLYVRVYHCTAASAVCLHCLHVRLLRVTVNINQSPVCVYVVLYLLFVSV